MEEIIDISSSIDELPSINLSSNKPSVNFGGGIELLMNDKRTKPNVSSEINLADLDELEDELNGLSSDINFSSGGGGGGGGGASRSDMFSQAMNSTPSSFKLNRDRDDASIGSIVSVSNEPNLGRSTAYSAPTAEPKTWDGFSKFSNVPLNPDKVMSEKPKMTPEELLLEKFKVLRKLEDLERKGANLTKK